MYTSEDDIRELEESLGAPLVTEMHYEIHPWEFDLVESSMADGRAHDVTFFIRKDGEPDTIAVIRKPFFPPDAFRAPSGAARPGEGLAAGAVRESREETGLDVELTRYLARISASFTCDGRSISWTTHIVEARQAGGELEPEDTEEIAEARWASLEELQGSIRDALVRAGWDLFRYRIALTDLAVERMEGDR